MQHDGVYRNLIELVRHGAGNGEGWCGYACRSKAVIGCSANLMQRPTRYSLQVMDEVAVTGAMYSFFL